MTERIVGPDIEDLVFIDHLGTGGYSDVFLYERRSPRMKVAVKVLRDVRLSDAELAQFAGEAETMAELADHPYIVQVFSTATTADGRPYLVMKYYPPPNLGARAARERFSVADVLRTGVKISSAVETAHRAGILHRDIKPANILVSQYGEPGLTDFGIAGHAADTDEADDLGVSIPWAPPEVLSGASNGSAQSDVYSLAATVWHLLVGRSPFEIAGGDNAARSLMSRVLHTPPPATGRADVPQSLERLLQQAMAKNPAVRPSSALDLARALQGIEQEQRFSRTEIVVDGLGAAHSSPSDRPIPGGSDQTRMRAARPSVAPSRPTPRRADTRFAPPSAEPKATVGPRGDAASASRQVAAVDVAPPTASRPATPSSSHPQPAPSDRKSPRVRASLKEDAPAATVLRPTIAPSEQPAPQPGRRGLKAVHVWGITAGLIATAVAVGLVTSSGRSATKAPDSQPTTLATDQLQVPNPPQQPTVVATYSAKTKSAHFTWSYANPQSGDYFYWAPSVDGSPRRVNGVPALNLSTANPATTCIVVRVVRTDGQSSLYSNPACG